MGIRGSLYSNLAYQKQKGYLRRALGYCLGCFADLPFYIVPLITQSVFKVFFKAGISTLGGTMGIRF